MASGKFRDLFDRGVNQVAQNAKTEAEFREVQELAKGLKSPIHDEKNLLNNLQNQASLANRQKIKEDKPGFGSPGLAATILASVFRSGRLGASDENDEENLRRPTLLGM